MRGLAVSKVHQTAVLLCPLELNTGTSAEGGGLDCRPATVVGMLHWLSSNFGMPKSKQADSKLHKSKQAVSKDDMCGLPVAVMLQVGCICKPLGHVTSNVAEYRALIAGLQVSCPPPPSYTLPGVYAA